MPFDKINDVNLIEISGRDRRSWKFALPPRLFSSHSVTAPLSTFLEEGFLPAICLP
jgi:hypothetical protein